MKKYFKTHIVKIDGYFYVRRLSTDLSWEFLNSLRSDNYWWSNAHKRYARFDTEKEAQDRYDVYLQSIKDDSIVKYL